MNEAIIRNIALIGPLMLAGALWLIFNPNAKARAGLLLSFCWNFLFLFLLNQAAIKFQWWEFGIDRAVFRGFPVDLWIGWAVLWGIVAPLLPIRSVMGQLTLFFWIDLMLMPLCDPVIQLGSSWLLGESLALLCVLVPGLCLFQWTKEDIRLSMRSAAQAILFTGMLLYLIPESIYFSQGKRDAFFALWGKGEWIIASFIGFIPAMLGVNAIQEFCVRGKGTPIPFDPPKHLVKSGIYRYIANPMQLSLTLLFLVLAFFGQSFWLVGVALISFVYGIGFAKWSEDSDLSQRFGDHWKEYRGQVRDWLPRWKPIADEKAVLYIAETCGVCSKIGRWFKSRSTPGLTIEAAENYTGEPLERIRYETSDHYRADGIAALGKALEHIHLGWALIGIFLRLPLMCSAIQLVVDASGGGKRHLTRDRGA